MRRIFTECFPKEIRFKNRQKFLPFSILSLLIAYLWHDAMAPKVNAQPVEYKSLSLNILLKNIPMNQGPFFTKGLSVTSLCPPIHTIRLL